VAADFPALQEIEVLAGKTFATLGMDLVARDDPCTVEQLAEYDAWLVEVDGRTVAYALVEWVDAVLHLEQISVLPEFAHRGIGATLITHIVGNYDTPALTLTTFVEVPWNGPYYERLGFRWLTPAEETPGLRKIRANEAAHGIDAWPRACMRRELKKSRPERPGQLDFGRVHPDQTHH
jgi:GNAT superfamily N-acetyltransferase